MDLRGLQGGRWQKFVTAAGMVGVVTAVLAGLCVGLLVALLSVAHPIAALGTGLLAVATTVIALMRIQAARGIAKMGPPVHRTVNRAPVRASGVNFNGREPLRRWKWLGFRWPTGLRSPGRSWRIVLWQGMRRALR